MIELDMNTIWNWVNEKNSSSVVYANDTVSFYSNFYKGYKEIQPELIAKDTKKIEEFYEEKLKKIGGCGTCRNGIKEAKELSLNQKINSYSELDVSFLRFVRGAINALKELNLESFKKQGYTLEEIYLFTSDNLKKPAKKTWSDVHKVYANT